MDFQPHIEAMRRAAARSLWDTNAVEDVVQDACIRAWNKRDEFDGANLRGFLCTIASNLAKNEVRRRKRANLISTTQFDDTVQEYADESVSITESIIDTERAEMMRAALTQLSDKHREIIEMHHLCDVSYEDIARKLGIAPGTVMSRLYRARKALKAIIEAGE